MAGKTDDSHLVDAGLALCEALRAIGRDPEAATKAIDEAEAHLLAVRVRGGKPEPKKEKE